MDNNNQIKETEEEIIHSRRNSIAAGMSAVILLIISAFIFSDTGKIMFFSDGENSIQHLIGDAFKKAEK